MVNAAWLFGKEDLSDAQLVIVEEEAEDAQVAQAAATTSGERAAEPACGSSGEGSDQADAGSGQAAKTAPKRGRDDDTKAATDNTEQPEPAAKRSRADSSSSSGGQVVLPIHKLVVMSASGFFKARLGAWQQSSSNGAAAEPCRVVLHVPAGQAEIGRRLVRAMYEAKPCFCDLGLEQQLQLLGLAERYNAPDVAAAAAAAAGIDVDDLAKRGLAWATVRAAYPKDPEEEYEDDPQLPAPPLRQYAADALQELFGDLEAVWASPHQCARLGNLLRLPFEALKVLLADERTRVASENVVVHTILLWLHHNNLEQESPQAEELLPLVRVARLTPHYARTVFCESELATSYLDESQLAVASMLPLLNDRDVALPGAAARLQQWRLPARPRSALADAAVLEWSPRLAALEDLATSLPDEGVERASVEGPEAVVWQGWTMRLGMKAFRGADGGVKLQLYMSIDEPPGPRAGGLIERTIEVAAASGGAAVRRSGTVVYTANDERWGHTDLFGLSKAGGDAGPPKDWAGVEAALRAQQLVHGDGDAAHLKLRCTITRVE
jgi:hypothetical protein